jgi:hypothetical protein
VCVDCAVGFSGQIFMEDIQRATNLVDSCYNACCHMHIWLIARYIPILQAFQLTSKRTAMLVFVGMCVYVCVCMCACTHTYVYFTWDGIHWIQRNVALSPHISAGPV